MKKLILYGMIGVLFFGLSAAGSYVLKLKRQSSEHADEETPGGEHDKAVGKSKDHEKGDGAASSKDAGHGDSAMHSSAAGHLRATHDQAKQLEASAEEISKQAANIRDRLIVVRQKESNVAAQQRNLDLIRQDIRNERLAMEGLRRQVEDEVGRLDEKLKQIDPAIPGPVPPKESAPAPEASVGGKKAKDSEVRGTKKASGIFKEMPAESAATVAEQMVKQGKLDEVVALLKEIPEKKAAAILAAIHDPATATQLATRFTQPKERSKRRTKRRKSAALQTGS